MSTDMVGVCVTILGSVLLSGIAIAVAVFFGLRNSVNPIADKLSTLKDDIVTELSNIKERIIKIEDTADNIWRFVSGYLQQGGSIATIVRNLKNFGETRISANPATSQTVYTIKVQRGRLDDTSISKISKITYLQSKEDELFPGQRVIVNSIGSNIIRVEIPSTDPEICTKYMSMFLVWLDTKYIEQLEAEIKSFEDDITV